MEITYFLLEINKNDDFIDSFVYDVYRSIKDFNSFKNNEKYYIYRTNISGLNQFTNNLIPVGSIEFVHNYLTRYNIIIPKPLNVPSILREYCSREIIDITKEELINNKSKYNNYLIKSNDNYKDFEINKVKYFDFESSKTENYFISSPIESEILSEYRCFVLAGKILSINNYIGDPIGLTNSHITTLKSYINKIDLRAFTIDIRF